MKKISFLIIKQTKLFLRFIINNPSIIVSIAAFFLAVLSYRNANWQFSENSKNSKKVYIDQLKNSKSLNDSLINQIRKLQEITNKQVKITDDQLKVSEEILLAQKYSGKPNILESDLNISDTNYRFNDLYSPTIEFKIKNVGLRYAYNIRTRNFLIYIDYSDFRIPKSTYHNFLEPSSEKIIGFQPKIDPKYKNEFYYCFDICYYDKLLKESFYQAYYYHYFRNRNNYDFYNCDSLERMSLRKYINKNSNVRKDNLFDVY